MLVLCKRYITSYFNFHPHTSDYTGCPKSSATDNIDPENWTLQKVSLLLVQPVYYSKYLLLLGHLFEGIKSLWLEEWMSGWLLWRTYLIISIITRIPSIVWTGRQLSPRGSWCRERIWPKWVIKCRSLYVSIVITVPFIVRTVVPFIVRWQKGTMIVL